jgi:hypothetical protein
MMIEFQKRKINWHKSNIYLLGRVKAAQPCCQGLQPYCRSVDWKKVASELLMEWTKLILKEFRVNAEKHVLTSCYDSGSDVKRSPRISISYSTRMVFFPPGVCT